MNTHSPNDITILPGYEGIRRRPTFYVGNTSKEGLYRFVLTNIHLMLDSQYMNGATTIHVTLYSDHSIKIADNGRGVPVTPIASKHPEPVVESVLTHLATGHPDQQLFLQLSFLHGWGFVLNSLTTWLILETTQQGMRYRVTTGRGRIKDSLQCLGLTEQRGTSLHFLPDPQIWQDSTLDVATLKDHLQEIMASYPDTTIVTDLATGSGD